MKYKSRSISNFFILFIVVSVVFWFLTKLSKVYESTLEYSIEYINLPENKLLQEEPVKKVEIYVKTTGFRIISNKLFPKKIKIQGTNIYLKSKTNYFLLLSQQRLPIQKQMNAGVTIDHFIKDSIFLNLGYLKQKKVPIQLNASISYAKGFDSNGGLTIEPDSVIVSGPQSIIDTIQFVGTNILNKNEANKSIKEIVSLKEYSDLENIKLNVKEITVSSIIEKFTEGTLKIPFSVINFPNDMSINTYPKEINLTYKVALSNFNEITPSSFVIECDYKMSVDNELRYLVPRLISQSELVKNVKISPNKIDFILEK